MCGQEQRELGLTPEENRDTRVCFALFSLRCRTNRMAAGSEAGRVGRMGGGEVVLVVLQQQTAESWRTARVHLIS